MTRRQMLAAIFGLPAMATLVSAADPVGSRAGSWALSQYSVDILERAGLVYDSSMMGRDEPYALMLKGQDTGIVELPVSWVEDDAPYLGRIGALPSPELIFRVYRDEFDMAYQEGTFLMLTFHPHISGRPIQSGGDVEIV